MASSLLRSGHRLLLRHQGRLPVAFATRNSSTSASFPLTMTLRPLGTTVPPPSSDRIWRLIKDISSLTLAEFAALSSLLLRCLDIPTPPIAILGLGGGGSAATGLARDKAAATNKKMVFELQLEGFNAASKIKEIRTFTNLGLKEAKELVEKVPAVIKGGLSKEEAEGIIEKMKAIGA